MINPVGGGTNTNATYSSKEKADVKSENTQKENESGVVLEISQKEEKTATYKKPVVNKPNIDDINRLKHEAEKATSSLRDLVEKLISRQGKTLEKVLSGEETVEVDAETRAQAQQMISEDGEFGVKNTAQRIVDYAKALAGGDKSKISDLRDAIKEGFAQAKEAFGGELPEISEETYKEVMSQLDQWEKEETAE